MDFAATAEELFKGIHGVGIARIFLQALGARRNESRSEQCSDAPGDKVFDVTAPRACE